MKTILELEKSVSATMIAAGIRGHDQASRDKMTMEQRLRRIYAEMEWARLQQEKTRPLDGLDFIAAMNGRRTVGR